MKAIFGIVSLFFAASSIAAVTTLNCELEKYPKQIVTFQMENLGKKGMTFVSNEDTYEVFKTKSKNKTIKRLVDTLNGQGGDLRISSDRISFFGDSAGIDFAYLDLFRASGYTKGFVRIDFDFNTEKDYSKLNCTLK